MTTASSIHIGQASNLHPYDCHGRGKCEHCDRLISGTHDPATCALCDDGFDRTLPLDDEGWDVV